MIDNLVSVLIEAIVGLQRIRVEFRTRLNVLSNFLVDVVLSSCVHNGRAYLSGFAAEQSEHDGLAIRSASANLLLTPVLVHVPSLAADQRLIRLNRARHPVDASGVHRVPDPLQHEPSSLLRYLQIAGNLVTADSILAVRQHPHRAKPLIESDRRILKDRSDLSSELLFAVQALPHHASREERKPLGLAPMTGRTFGPLHSRDGLQTHHRVGKVLDCFHQSRWPKLSIVCHENKIALLCG
jgi:hypothetical protein